MHLAPLFDDVMQLSDAALYALLFAAALLENLLPPVPGDATVAFGGYLAGLGRLSLPLAFAWVTLGSWCGFMIYYGLGRVLGRSRVHAWIAGWVHPDTLARGEDWVRRYGYWVVVGNRLLAGARSVISLVAGFAGLRLPLVAVLALISSVVWNAFVVGGGYAVGDAWESVVVRLGRYQWALTAALGLAALVWLAWRLRRRPESSRR